MDLTLENIRRVFSQRQPQPIGPHRFFSVLVPLVEKDGALHLLYEVRAKNMASQPGEVCFPGGHVEEGESPRDAALRETFEEIGIRPAQVDLIGPGDILYGYANYTLYTYLGVLDYRDVSRAVLAKEEVDEIFLVRLSDLESHPPQIFSEEVLPQLEEDFPYEKLGIDRSYHWRTGRWDIPVYEIRGRIIWGLTARITSDLIDVVKNECPL